MDKATIDTFETIKQRYTAATEQNLELILELMTSNDELAQVLQDIHTLCDERRFKPEIFLDFIGQGNKRQFMQYHNDYHQKTPNKKH